MIILPAIDLRGGKVVRLFQGQFDQMTEYGKDPLDMAKYFQDQGAEFLHIVDLDGAQSGERQNQNIIKNIAKKVSIPIQTGGGIRSLDVIKDYLDEGIQRVILGTQVVEDKNFLTQALSFGGQNIAMSLDCANGFVAQRGWLETSQLKGTIFAQELVSMGLKYIIYTDIARDGTLMGPNIAGLQEMLTTVNCSFIASGGIKDIQDIQSLLDLKNPRLYGVITGKAIYENRLQLKEAIALCNTKK